MKKFTKKFFALLLSVFMLASLVPFAAMAEGEEDPITPPQDIQDEFTEENGYTPALENGAVSLIVAGTEENICGILGVDCELEINVYKHYIQDIGYSYIYVCDYTVVIREDVTPFRELKLNDLLSIPMGAIVPEPGDYFRFNINFRNESAYNYSYQNNSLEFVVPEWYYGTGSGLGFNSGYFFNLNVNTLAGRSWNLALKDLGFWAEPHEGTNGKGETIYYLNSSEQTAVRNVGDDKLAPKLRTYFNVPNDDTRTDAEIVAEYLDDYYLAYFNGKREANNQAESLADLTIEEIEVIARPGDAYYYNPDDPEDNFTNYGNSNYWLFSISSGGDEGNYNVNEYIYWRYLYERTLRAGGADLTPSGQTVPTTNEGRLGLWDNESYYATFADKTTGEYTEMNSAFAGNINTNGDTIKLGFRFDGYREASIHQNYMFPIPINVTLVYPDGKEDLPGLEKWIVTDFYEILDVDPDVQVTTDLEGNLFDPEGNLIEPPTVPEGREVVGPIIETRDDGTSWLTGWNIHVTKVKLDTIGAGDTVNFLLESNLGRDFLEIFPDNYPIHGNNVNDTEWDLNDLDAFDAYTFTFHDVMAPELSLIRNSIVVKVGGREIPESITWTNEEGTEVTTQIYEVVTPGEEHQVLDENGNPIPVLDENGEPMLDENGNPVYETETCTFEVKITGLVALFLADYFEYEQIGALPITVEYTAHADEDLTAGSYVNEAWVTANDFTTPPDEVTVITYALQVYKHDSVELEPGDENYTPLPLAGAVFYLYQESQGHPVTDGNGNVTGWEPSEDENGNPVTPFKQGITNEDGQLIEYVLDEETGEPIARPIFDGLDAGTYYIVEVQAPAGYVCDHNYYPINIGGINTNPDIGAPVNENPEHPVNFTYTYDVPNVLVPHTGGTGTVVFSVIGACMLVCAGAMYVVYRRRLRAEA